MAAQDESLAPVYAKALLDLAFEAGVHAEVLAELKEFGGILATEGQFRTFLNTPNIRQSSKKDVVQKVFGGVVSDPTLHFLQVVIDKRRQELLPAMIAAFEDGYHDRMGELVVRVKSAVSITDAHRGRLVGCLKEKYEKEIILEESVDARLLGGLVLRVGDTRIDGTLRTRLQSIGNVLEVSHLKSEDYYED